ncbi:MAG: zinc ribbon domain-containing protein [Chloroflexi bacterium]|nr:MAG: zinc ribbon domain-containing protein [Chloroflexota bacterium]
MAVQVGYCGRCGAALTPGAPFCGTCGTPVGPVVPLAAAASATPAAYQAYAYPRAVAAPRPQIGPQVAISAALIGIILIVTIAVTAFAIRQSAGSHQNCTANCSPRVVTPLPASATYTSLQYKYELDYSERWTVRSQDAAGIELGTDIGLVRVAGTSSSQPLDQVIQGLVSGLPTATYQNVTRVDDLKGAHIGDQNGLGAIYAANLIGANSKATKIRFAVIAATRGGVTVTVFALDPADTARFANGMPEGYVFDYMCSQFRWSS